MPPRVDRELLARLVERCRRGEAQAFEQVFGLFRGPLYSYLARTTGDGHLAEDLLQDVFLRVIDNLDRYEESGRFEAWLFRIAANRVRDWARRQSHGERVGGVLADPGSQETLAVDRPVEQPPDVALLADESVRRLEACLADLEEQDRQVLVLRHYSDLSFREIAGILDCPLGTVLARSHRALAKLRQMMERSG